MDIRMDNKKALVTGGTRDIGRVIVEKLVQCGAEVYSLGRSKTDMDKLVANFPSVHPVVVDLIDWEATRKAVEEIGVMDMLVNAAGTVTYPKPFTEVSKEDFEKTFQINILATANVSQVVAKGMLSSGKGGAIVNISSASTTIPLKGLSAFDISKGGIDVMTKCMAAELAPSIRVNSVNPMRVNTPMAIELAKTREDPLKDRYPLKRYVNMEEVADTVVYLLSDKASYISGTSIPLDGAFLCS